MRKIALCIMLTAVSACAGGSSTMPVITDPSMRAPGTANTDFRRADMTRESGLEDILGQRAPTLLARLGEARIDLAEGDVRKLQFAGRDCVLDIYLYPQTPGGEPVAAHVEARKRQGGADTGKRQCLEQVQRR